MTTVAIVRSEPRSGLSAFEPQDLKELIRFAEWMADSGLVPSHLRSKPKDIVLVAIRGRELGLSLMQAMASIYLVEGKLSLAAELWVALVKRHPDCEYFRLVESTDAVATYVCKRRGAEPVPLSYTIAQAKAAQLTGKGTWTKHPAAMLRARCAAALARAEFPDAALAFVEHDEAEEITGRPVPVTTRAAIEPEATTHEIASGQAQTEHDEAEEIPEPEPVHSALAEFREYVLHAGPPLTCEQAASIWVDHRGELRQAGTEVGAQAWKELCDAIIPPPKPRKPNAELQRAVKAIEAKYPPPDGEGPRGGGAPRPANDAPAEDADAAEAAAVAAEGNGAAASASEQEARWREHLLEHAHAFAVANSVAKNELDPAYAALGADAMVRIAIARMVAVSAGTEHPLGEMGAMNAIRAARVARARKQAARVPARLRAA